MLDAVVGALIMVVATSALVLAIEVAEKSISNAGRQPLNAAERELLLRVGHGDTDSILKLEADLEGLPRQ